jgi:hypothetical protein
MYVRIFFYAAAWKLRVSQKVGNLKENFHKSSIIFITAQAKR